MKLEDIPQFRRYTYEKECRVCGIKQIILTQNNDFAEYETEVYLLCQCGDYIEFELPVN